MMKASVVDLKCDLSTHVSKFSRARALCAPARARARARVFWNYHHRSLPTLLKTSLRR
jgi:hypothetical protein